VLVEEPSVVLDNGFSGELQKLRHHNGGAAKSKPELGERHCREAFFVA
jgi:hypothetical protein